MNNVQEITFEQIKHLLPEETHLCYVDYLDSLDEHKELIAKCLEGKSAMPLYEAVDDWFIDAPSYAITYLNGELKDDIEREFDLEDAQFILDQFEDEIRDHYYRVDKSDVLGDLARNSSNLLVRVEMYSNFDCINSHHLEGSGGYSYEETYFGDMVDVLNLNPSRVSEILTDNGIKIVGNFPDIPERNGEEFVSYSDFHIELINSCCGANLLTFVGSISIEELIKRNFDISEIGIPKGNVCGLFSSFQGGGSLMEMELNKPMKIAIEKPRDENKTEYDTFGFTLDGENGYGIKQVYGVCNSFFGGELS